MREKTDSVLQFISPEEGAKPGRPGIETELKRTKGFIWDRIKILRIFALKHVTGKGEKNWAVLKSTPLNWFAWALAWLLGCQASTAGGKVFNPGQGTAILHGQQEVFIFLYNPSIFSNLLLCINLYHIIKYNSITYNNLYIYMKVKRESVSRSVVSDSATP